MATVAYSAFLPEVLPHVPGIADIVAINAIRNAAVEFCTKSRVWNEVQDDVSVTADDFPYDIEVASGTVATGVMSVKFDGTPLEPTSIELLDQDYPGWETVEGEPVKYFQINATQFGVYPLPDTTYTMRMRVAYTPSRTSTGVDSFIYENYLEELAAGALKRLLTRPEYASTSGALATYYKAIFDDGVISAQSDAVKSLIRESLRVRSA